MGKSLSFFARHDANMSVYNEDNIESYVEFEKFTKKRYFSFSLNKGDFRREISDIVLPHLNPHEVSRLISNWLTNDQEEILRETFQI